MTETDAKTGGEDVEKPRDRPAYDEALRVGELHTLSVMDALPLLEEQMVKLISHVRSVSAPPDGRTRELLNVRANSAAALLGRSETWLRKVHGEMQDADGGAAVSGPGFTAADLAQIRHQRQLQPLPPKGSPYVVSIINQKGGAGKTTTTLNLAQDAAMRGYRVLIIDADPQASITCSMLVDNGSGDLVEGGGLGLETEQTLAPVLAGDSIDLRPLIRHTHWPTIDIVPNGPNGSEGEIWMINELTDAAAENRSPLFWISLAKACENLTTEEYDLIFIDCPPSLSLVSISICLASNGMIVPIPPRNLDLESLKSFVRTINKYLSSLRRAWQKEPDWLRFLLTMKRGDSRGEGRNELLARRYLGEMVLSESVPRMEALERSSGGAPSVFEAPPPQPRSLARSAAHARKVVQGSNDEIFRIIAKQWEK